MALNFANNNSLSAITSLPASISSGGLILLQTQTASASGSISFTSGIDSTYDSYIFKYYNIHPDTNNVHWQGNFSTDGGSNWNVTKTTSAFYTYHDEADTTTLLSYASDYDVAQGTGDFQFQQSAGNDADHGVNGQLQLFNPSSTTFVKHFIAVHSGNIVSSYAFNTFHAGYCNTTSAVNGIIFRFNSGNIDSGIIKMYGVA